MIEVYSPDAPAWLTFLKIFCKVLFLGPPPGKRSMFVPSGWPSCFVRHIGDFTADKWLTESFEDEESCTTIQRVDNIRVSHVAHYKTVQGLWQHEFIVVTLVDRSRGKYARSEPLYLHYDRSSDEVDEEKKKRLARLKASRASSILSDQPVRRQDDLVPWSQTDVDKLNRDLRKGKTVLLKGMTFPSDPTILDLAAVLEAHSTLSPQYRLFATMCYWYAGSTYEVLKHIYEGRSEDAKHARKSGKLGPITGYRAVREKQDARDMSSLVESVKKQLIADKDNPVPEEELDQVAREELERIPKFETLLQRSIERRAEVMALLERREIERIRFEGQGRELEAKDRELDAKDRELEAKDRELAAAEAELRRVQEEMKVLQSPVPRRSQ